MPETDNEPAMKSLDELIKSLSQDNKGKVHGIYILDKEITGLIELYQTAFNTELVMKAAIGDKRAYKRINFEKIEVLMQLLCVNITRAINFNKEGALIETSRMFREMFSDMLHIAMKNGQLMNNEKEKS